MIERYLQLLTTDDAGTETAAATRERLKGHFPPGSTRRMTTLGMLVGRSLAQLGPTPSDTIVYASAYAESCALESFLDSFPTPSPTLFQTSIHPSAVQQLMIGRQEPVLEFNPMSGGRLLAFHALRTAFLAPTARVLLCGGEEKGTWLLSHGLASDRTFAFAASFHAAPQPGSLARFELTRGTGAAGLDLASFFGVLHGRTPWDGGVAPGWNLRIAWL